MQPREARDLDLVGSQVRERRSGLNAEFPFEKFGGRDPHGPALERDRRDLASWRTGRPVKRAKRCTASAGSVAAIHTERRERAPFG